MIKTIYAHDVTTVNLTIKSNCVDVELFDNSPSMFPVSSLTVFRSNLAPSAAPAITYDGIDIPALLEAARAALRSLYEAYADSPAPLHPGVTEARARLLGVLRVEASE